MSVCGRGLKGWLLVACAGLVWLGAARADEPSTLAADRGRQEPPHAWTLPATATESGPSRPAALPQPFVPPAGERVTAAAYSSPAAESAVPAPASHVATSRAVPLPLPASHGLTPLPLAPPAHGKGGAQAKSLEGLVPMVSTLGSLAVVVGLFLLMAWVFRRSGARGSMVLPGTVFEVLGRAPLTGRQQVHLLRCGSKLLLVSVTPGGAETLTEVTEPAEVDRLAGLCRQPRGPSATAAFRQVFQQFAPRGARRVAASGGDRRHGAGEDGDVG